MGGPVASFSVCLCVARGTQTLWCVATSQNAPLLGVLGADSGDPPCCFVAAFLDLAMWYEMLAIAKL